jgi:hypothetical protein
MLHSKYLCSRHFLESDFTTAGRVHLNRLEIPCGSHSSAPTFPKPPHHYIPFPSIPCLQLLSSEDDLHVLSPTRAYSKTPVPCAATPVPIHGDIPSTSFQTSVDQPSPMAANTFSVKEVSYSLRSVNINASDGELEHIISQSSSSKPRAKHSLLKRT